MSDIELIIKISEEDLKSVADTILTISEMYETTQGRVYRAIVNGIPLPKGHGDLIDKSDLVTTTDIRADGSEFTYVSYSEIDNAPTIIEACVESEDNNDRL